METLLEILLNKNTPCAVLKYDVWLKTDPSVITHQHELLFIDRNDFFRTHRMTDNEVRLFKSKMHLFKIAAEEKGGIAYEFNQFKEYKELKGVKHR